MATTLAPAEEMVSEREQFASDCRELRRLGVRLAELKELKEKQKQVAQRVWTFVQAHRQEFDFDGQTTIPGTEGAVLAEEVCPPKVDIRQPLVALRYIVKHRLLGLLLIHREAIIAKWRRGRSIPGIEVNRNTQTLLKYPGDKVRVELDKRQSDNE